MSIVPASRLSSSDLALLGNNLEPHPRRSSPRRRRNRYVLAGVNRSLARLDEQVSKLDRPDPLLAFAR